MSLVASGGLPFGAKDKLYYVCVRIIALYGSETWLKRKI